MISFNEWINEIAISGSLGLVDQPTPRRSSKLAPDASASRIFRVRLNPSVLSMIRSFATDSGGLPEDVQGVLDSMVGGVAMMSNEDADAFRRVASEMRGSGGVMSHAAAEIDKAIENSVREAVK